MKVTLKSCNGYFLTAEDGGAPQGAVIARRPGGLMTCRNEAGDGPGPWEEFDLEVVGQGLVALKSHGGFYVCAETVNGEVTHLVANRTQIGAWETFEVVLVPSGDHAFALKAHTGKFVCIEFGGPGAVVCNRDAVGSWETLTPSRPLFDGKPAPGTSPVPSLRGQLRLPRHNGKQVIQDETGDVLPVWCHDGSGFSDWVHGQEDAVRARVRKMRGAGFVGKRDFTIVGYYDQNRPDQPGKWKAWAGREVTPIGFTAYSGRWIDATPHYYDRKAEYIRMLHDEGMTLLDDRGDLVAFTEAQAVEHMRVNGLLYNQLGDLGRQTLAGLWACNEGWQNLPGGKETPELCAAMLHAFKAGAGWWPDMRGMSCPPGSSEEPGQLMAWGVYPATVMTVHGSRIVNSHLIPHYFNYGRDVRPITGQTIVNTEPIGDGEGVSVGRTNDPEVLTALCAVSLISGCPWVHMSGRGVWGEDGPDGPGGIDTQAGFYEVPKVPTFLPRDIFRFPIVQHSGRTQVHRFIEAGEVEGSPRFDFALDPGTGRFAGMLHATDWAPVRMLKSCAELTVTNLVSGQVERQGPMDAGRWLDHPYRRARLLTGRLA